MRRISTRTAPRSKSEGFKQPLQHDPAQEADDEHGERGDVDVARNLTGADRGAHRALDTLAQRAICCDEGRVDLGHEPDRLAEQLVVRAAERSAADHGVEVRVDGDEQRLEAVLALERRLELVVREVGLELVGQHANQLALRAEALVHQSAAVAGLLADLRERGAGEALLCDQVGRGVEQPARRERAALGLRAGAGAALLSARGTPSFYLTAIK